MKSRILVSALALVFGMLGMGLAFVAQHLYQDHALFHELVRIEAQRQQAAQKAMPVAPAPEAK